MNKKIKLSGVERKRQGYKPVSLRYALNLRKKIALQRGSLSIARVKSSFLLGRTEIKQLWLPYTLSPVPWGSSLSTALVYGQPSHTMQYCWSYIVLEDLKVPETNIAVKANASGFVQLRGSLQE